jgi:signal transduction histidine kinase
LARPSALLTSCLLAANLVMVGWWTWLQVRHAEELQTAAAHLRDGDAHAAARALGASESEELPDIAAARKRMFLSEGIAFAVFVLGAGIAVLVMLRRQARLDADHDRFLAGATHELKTPLATIQLLLESVRGDRLPRTSATATCSRASSRRTGSKPASPTC